MTHDATAGHATAPLPRPAARPIALGHVLLGLSVLAILAGIAVPLGGLMLGGLVLTLTAAAAVYAAPQLGPYLWLALSPLIVGIERGQLLPFIRPNEALLLLILGAVAARVVPAMLAGTWRVPSLGRIDLALGFLLLTGSILPPILRLARDLPLETADLLYSLVLTKYVLLYLVFRVSIRTVAQVRVCLVLAVAAAMPVAIIALLQVNGLLGVPELLATYYDKAFSGTEGPITSRGTSTVASTFGVANIMTLTGIVVLGWSLASSRLPPHLVAAAVVCLLGVVAAGQFSGFIGMAVALGAAGWLLGRLRQLLALALPVLLLAMLALWPVVEERLAGFERDTGLPQSWEGRIDNLERFILPELAQTDNWLTGVRPSPQIPAPERWRDWVYIESGYLWLLWIGGVPFLVAFATFAGVGLTELARIARSRSDAIGIAALASAAGLAMIAVLMLLDPHLTMRGGADLFYPLLALALVEVKPAALPRSAS